ncbi:helix-turn-helix domain-containing protein [Corynebacterium xerosis]|nr:helix-turn-helix transcriptional regulator [Corynebacterium xerosis]
MTTNKDEQQLRTIVDNNLLRTIRKRRYEANKPQEWVRSQLRTLGVHLGKSAYAKLERGERGISFDEAIALSMIFDISLDSLRPTPSEVDSLSNDSEDPSVVHPIAVAEVITAAIRDERIERGWSMSELAKAARDGYSLPLHTTTIQRIENGERDLRMAEAFALAQILKIDLEKYIGPRNAKEE